MVSSDWRMPGQAQWCCSRLFEEQLRLEQLALHHHLTEGTESYPEALSYFPQPRAIQGDLGQVPRNSSTRQKEDCQHPDYRQPERYNTR